MNEINQAIAYFEDAIRESDEIIADCSEALQAGLTEQKRHFEVALAAIRRYQPEPKAVIPNKRIPGIGRCPTCKQDLCMDDEKLHYCPTCGTHLIVPEQPGSTRYI